MCEKNKKEMPEREAKTRAETEAEKEKNRYQMTGEEIDFFGVCGDI